MESFVRGLILLAIAVSAVTAVGYTVYVLLEALRGVLRIGFRARWIDGTLAVATGLIALMTVLFFLRNTPRDLSSDIAQSVSNAPDP
jgi:hypothetical protein